MILVPDNLHGFINGAMMAACFVVGLLFARSYRDTRDQFFRSFAIAFVLLGLERIAILMSGGVSETHAGVYLIRCVAFLVIIYAVIDKNRR